MNNNDDSTQNHKNGEQRLCDKCSTSSARFSGVAVWFGGSTLLSSDYLQKEQALGLQTVFDLKLLIQKSQNFETSCQLLCVNNYIVSDNQPYDDLMIKENSNSKSDFNDHTGTCVVELKLCTTKCFLNIRIIGSQSLPVP